MQLKPREKFVVVRQLDNPNDSGTYYVQAKVRNAHTDALLDTLNLSNKGGQRFTSEWQVAADPSGQGYYIDIETIVYLDSGYSQVSDVYARENETFLIAERDMPPFGAGGADVNYKRIGEIFRGVTKELEAGRTPKKPINLKGTEDRLYDAIQAVGKAVAEIEVPDHNDALKGLREAISKAQEALGSKIDERPRFEKTDLQPVFSKLEETESGILSAVQNGTTRMLGAFGKAFDDKYTALIDALKALTKKYNDIPFLPFLPRPQEDKVEVKEPPKKEEAPAPVRNRRIPKTGGFAALAVIAVIGVGSLLVASAIQFFDTPEPAPEALAIELAGTVSSLPQMIGTTSPDVAITQATPNKAIKITGLTTGLCLTLNASSILTTTTCGSGGVGGGGGGAFATNTANTLTYTTTQWDVLIGANSTTSNARLEVQPRGTSPAAFFNGNVGVGTSSPYAKLSVVGQVVATNFTATGTSATSTFTNANVTGNLQINLTDSYIPFSKSGILTGTSSLTFNQGTHFVTLNGLKFNGTSSVPQSAATAGTFYFDATEDRFDLHTGNCPSTEYHIGYGYEQVRNNTGSTIVKGKPVYINGNHGGTIYPTVTLAQGATVGGSGSLVTTQSMGIVTEDIANNSYGCVQTLGSIENINTSAWSAGDILYLSTTTAGGLVNFSPQSPDVGYRVATVERSHATLGRLYIQPGVTRIGLLTQGNIPYGSSIGFLNQSSTFTFDGSMLTVGSASTTNFSSTHATATTKLNIPDGSAPSLQIAGDIALDSTANEFLIATSSANDPAVFKPYKTFAFSYSSSTQGSGTTTRSMGPVDAAGYFTTVQCDFNNFMHVMFYDGTNRMPDLVASATIGTFTLSTANNIFTSGEALRVDIGTTTNINANVFGGCRAKYVYTRN